MIDLKFDMHCHTKEGSLDGKVPIGEYISILKEKGFDGMLVSDHNSYNGYRYWRRHLRDKQDFQFTVLRGIEYDTIDAGHILVIMPENVKLTILELRGLPVRLLADYVHRHGGILGPAHPCGERHLSIMKTYKHKHHEEIIKCFDFLEGFNACEEVRSNERAAALCDKYGKPGFGGSDAHKPDCVGLAWTEFEKEIEKESDLIALIKEAGKEATKFGGEYYSGTTKRKIGKWNHVLVESFWFYNKLGGLLRRHKRRVEMKLLKLKFKEQEKNKQNNEEAEDTEK